ncbi:MAG: tetratricopeptide repeat protein [Prevotellaceae bacterium]|jgi:TolA-binding protein|nr:tetratricopeptide repeat protein [Prevotellaceae bacterium]
MNRRLIILSLALVPLLYNGNMVAQKPTLPSFEQALALYNQQFYIVAQKDFVMIEQSLGNDQPIKKGEAAGYALLCHIALGYTDLENLLEAYIENYPYSTLISEIWFRLANHLFASELYEKALHYYNKCSFSSFDQEKRAEIAFKAGYSAFKAQELHQAELFLSQVFLQKIRRYDIPATYYLAYIRYINRDFTQAIEGFSKTTRDVRFAGVAPYYIIQSRFLLKQYQQVVSEGEELYNRSQGEEKRVLARILTESFFELNRLEDALRYLDAYQKNSKNISREDNYLAGMIHYAQKRYGEAIPFFEETGQVLDSLGQNAHYYLGETYIHTKDKLSALNSFRIASSLDFDPVITEDAFFNYAKLSFDLNNHIGSFNTYMERYPNTQKATEIQSYIADAYLLNKDYRSALTALSAIKNPDPVVLGKLQRASFLRGMQLVGAGSYREAEILFNQAINTSGNLLGINVLATYWKAESLFRSNRYQESIDTWNNFLSICPSNFASTERRMALYHIAYAHFQGSNWALAEQYFANYLSGGNPQTRTYYADAQNRLGDCAFMSKAYSKAIDYYALAMEKNGLLSDYSLFQMALSQGLIFQQSKKIATLQQLINTYPSGPFAVPASFELGRTLVQTGAYSSAEAIFNTLIKRDDATQFYSKTLIELGLIWVNLKKPEKALGYYKQVLEGFPETPEAENALAGIENIYMEQNNAQGYFDYIARLGIDSRKSADEKEQMLFNAGEQLFILGSHHEALKSLRSLLQQYPNGARSTQSHFYIAESLRLTGKEEEAADEYLTVMRTATGSFAEQATLHYARISYRLEKYDEAARGYESLAEIAKLDNNLTEAEIGKSRSYFKEQLYDQTILQTEKTLKGKGLSQAVIQELTYIKGKSHLALGQREQALAIFQKLSNEVYTSMGAESAYLLIQDAYNAGNFAKAEEYIYALSDSDSPQHYWIALSFIILGDIYADQNEIVQALATYQSLLDEYKPEKPDNIHDIVRLRIEKYNTQLKKK